MSLAGLALGIGLMAAVLPAQQTNPPPPTESYPFAKGTLERLNLGASLLTIRTSAGTRSFEATPRTYIFRGKDKIALDKLKIGEDLKISYYTNALGQALVKRIKVDSSDATNGAIRSPEVSK